MERHWTMLATAVLVSAALSLPGPAYAQTTVFQDDFEDDPLGGDPGTPLVGEPWVLDQQQYDYNIRIGDSGGSNSLACQRYGVQSQSPNAQAHLTSEDAALTTGKEVTIQLNFIKPVVGDSRALFYLQGYDDATRFVNVWGKDDGTVSYYDTSEHATGLTYDMAAWHELEIVADMTAQTYTISVDTNATPGSTDIPFAAAADTLTNVNIGSGKSGAVYSDDWLITVPEQTLVPGDANGDGCVDDLDLTALAVHWQQATDSWENGDFNGDGIVDDLDLTALAVNWQVGCGGGGGLTAAAVPEPATVVLLALGGMMIQRRRR